MILAIAQCLKNEYCICPVTNDRLSLLGSPTDHVSSRVRQQKSITLLRCPKPSTQLGAVLSNRSADDSFGSRLVRKAACCVYLFVASNADDMVCIGLTYVLGDYCPRLFPIPGPSQNCSQPRSTVLFGATLKSLLHRNSIKNP